VAWGYNSYGQCNVPSPNTGFVAIAAGVYHSLGVRADGSIVAWGAGQAGQSGWPHYGQSVVPSPNTGFVAITGGFGHSLGVKADGSIVAWGWNSYGQCNVPSPNTGFVVIAAGDGFSQGLKAVCKADLAGDLWRDCTVDLRDLLVLAGQWMSGACIEPGWCGGADITYDHRVGIEDLAAMAEEWMK
jgi:hypothetical protein